MLYETYRPRAWAGVLGQPKATATLKRLESLGKLGGKAYWISGKSGTGKTTLARIIASKLSDEWHTTETDAAAVTVSVLQEWTEAQFSPPMTCGGRVYILNEAHGLRKDTIRALLVFLEGLRPYTTVIFTTTNEGQLAFEGFQMDAGPLLSRCLLVKLASQGLAKPFAARLREIAQAEGLDGQPLAKYERWFTDNGTNMRAAIQMVESGGMMT